MRRSSNQSLFTLTDAVLQPNAVYYATPHCIDGRPMSVCLSCVWP